MCTYYYLHHHHLAPCTRTIDIVVHYSFCPDATTMMMSTDLTTTTTASSSSSSSSSAQQHQHQQQTYPCGALYYDQAQSVDHDNPCASGGCLASPECGSGGCRLEELGGRWTCCQCGRGGNGYKWCCHPMKKSPDTFCYHVVCEFCTADG